MWVKQCHEPAMTSWNAFHHAPIYGDAGGCMTHSLTHMFHQILPVRRFPGLIRLNETCGAGGVLNATMATTPSGMQ